MAGVKKQMGVIVKGNGINWEERAAEAKKRGFEVRDFDEYVELWGTISTGKEV